MIKSSRQARSIRCTYHMNFIARIGRCFIFTGKADISRSNRQRTASFIMDVELVRHHFTRRLVHNRKAYDIRINRTVKDILDRIRHNNSLIIATKTTIRHRYSIFSAAVLAVVLARIVLERNSNLSLTPFGIQLHVSIRSLDFHFSNLFATHFSIVPTFELVANLCRVLQDNI